MMEEDISQFPEQDTEVTETVAVEEQFIDYTEQIYDCTNSILSVLLFVGFAILGFFSAIQIFGKVKP